jgi:diguanylate cyclase (GGDEF)-like protein
MSSPDEQVTDTGGRGEGRFGRLKRAATGAPAPPVAEPPVVLDPVTGLPVRDHLHDWVDRAVRRSRPTSSRVVVAFLSVGLLRDVNDTQGADRGDQLLRATAERLETIDLPGTRVLRYEGAEFALIFEQLNQANANEEIARFLVDLLAAPFVIDGDAITVAPSVGTAISADNYHDIDELIHDAHQSLAHARDEGLHWEVHDETQRGRYETRIDEVRLRKAVDEDEFVLHYQPIVRTATGNVVGFEALLRWKAPGATNAGVLHPRDFVPLLEKSGLSVPVGRWSMVEACRQMAQWGGHWSRPDPLFATINISPRHLAETAFIDDVAAAVREAGVPPHWLCLDITEPALRFTGNDARPKLRALSELGVRLSLDDFGIGVASLHWLLDLSLDFLRLDRTFISQLGINVGIGGRGLAEPVGVVVRHLNAMANELGVQLIAEGVESAEEVIAVGAVGIPLAQGYHYGRPEPASVAVARVDPSAVASGDWDPGDVLEHPVVDE